VIGPLAVATLVATGALAIFGLVLAVLNRPPGRELRFAVWAVVALLAVQALLGAVRSFGVTLPEQSTFLIYLVVSVCVLPIATNFAYAEPTRWSGAVVAAGAVATLVAVLRLQGLWAAGV
jgi:predicted membrane channel-forming protein YqfA (hemolysin III family)